jgi:hypothetical protein
MAEAEIAAMPSGGKLSPPAIVVRQDVRRAHKRMLRRASGASYGHFEPFDLASKYWNAAFQPNKMKELAMILSLKGAGPAESSRGRCVDSIKSARQLVWG